MCTYWSQVIKIEGKRSHPVYMSRSVVEIIQVCGAPSMLALEILFQSAKVFQPFLFGFKV